MGRQTIVLIFLSSFITLYLRQVLFKADCCHLQAEQAKKDDTAMVETRQNVEMEGFPPFLHYCPSTFAFCFLITRCLAPDFRFAWKKVLSPPVLSLKDSGLLIRR